MGVSSSESVTMGNITSVSGPRATKAFPCGAREGKGCGGNFVLLRCRNIEVVRSTVERCIDTFQPRWTKPMIRMRCGKFWIINGKKNWLCTLLRIMFCITNSTEIRRENKPTPEYNLFYDRLCCDRKPTFWAATGNKRCRRRTLHSPSRPSHPGPGVIACPTQWRLLQNLKPMVSIEML